jgi:hypothetical protein
MWLSFFVATGVEIWISSLLQNGHFLAMHLRAECDAHLSADDEDVDWPGPKALPATIALISFFALNVFVQGIRAGV